MLLDHEEISSIKDERAKQTTQTERKIMAKKQNAQTRSSMMKDEIKKVVENSKSSKGVFALSTNGKLFFLSDEEAKRGILAPKIASALGKKMKFKTIPPLLNQDSCDNILDWLSNPRTPRNRVWMGVAKEYLEKC
jgi:hypothetical protein